MPQKIDFNVVYVTSEDPKFRSDELNIHGPTVRGWQSEKYCNYPQEIVVQLGKRCTLNRIQILAHEYLIPSKIELFSSNEDTNVLDKINILTWDYLGYITLSDNQSTNFKSRELKSVNVPVNVASFVKLKLDLNHNNNYNNYNQVSLIAINVLGTEIQARRPSNTDRNDKLLQIVNDPDYLSPYDDLAFEMYIDMEIAKIIRDMEIKKHLAVIDEQFEYARQLKQAMESLRQAGEKLGKYELEKRHAIEMENYEKAQMKKNQIDEYRSIIYQKIQIDRLLENDGQNHQTIEIDEKHLLSPTAKSNEKKNDSPKLTQNSPLHVSRHQSPKKGSSNSASPTGLYSRGGSFRRRNKSAGAITKSTYELYEDKPLPVLRHSQTNEFLRECLMDNEYKITSKLTEREKKQAALPIAVFGNDVVEKFYSKHYCDKEEGLKMLKTDLLSYDTHRMHTANKTARAATFLLHRALRDKVFSVYNLANEVIRLFFLEFIPDRVSSAEVARSVDKLLPELLTKSGDTSARIHHMAVHTILTMADCKDVRELHIIPVHLSRPVSSSTHPRLALSRAEMVEQLIINHGISTEKQSGLTCRTLSDFGSSGLHHPAEAVRKVSERILVLVYKVNPRLVRKQLPPDDDITRRNLLYRQLFHEFDKIDFQRKKELLEKNRALQTNNNTTRDSLNVEPLMQEIVKSPSASNIFNNDEPEKNYTISKSFSGSEIKQTINLVKKSEDKQGSSSASGISSPTISSPKTDDEKQCIFCNQPESTILAICNSMNSHYWRSCPMLVRCKECNQVIEIPTFIDHLLGECEKRENYTRCTECTEAVKLNELQKHTNNCLGLTPGHNKCPLCHQNFEGEWKKHLMGDEPCTKNTRFKTLQIQKQVKIQE